MDTLSPEERSARMARVRGKDTKRKSGVGHNLPHLAPITCGRDPITVFAQEFRHELPDLAVIIDEEDVCLALDGFGHGSRFG